jgi:predicted nucleotidyltransferase
MDFHSALIEDLRRAHGVHTLILYGSHARGDATSASDIDVAGFADVDPHIRKKPHGSLRRVDFLGRQPRRVFERLTNVLFLEIRMIAEHLVYRSSVRNLLDDHRNGNAHAAYARASAHDLGIESDALEHDVAILEW